MRDKNAAIQLVSPITKDKDGGGGEILECQIIIDAVDNGYLVNITKGEDSKAFVYSYRGAGDMGPKGMFQNIIDSLGLSDKIKLS